MLQIGSNVPRPSLFRFENFWLQHPSFLETVSLHWHYSPFFGNTARNLSSRLKHARAGLKLWSKNLSSLSKLTYNCKWVLLLLDGLEDQQNLSRMERNFRILVKRHLSELLESRRTYWKQRSKMRWVMLGDENTELFHSIATISHKRNFIVSLSDNDGNQISDHDQKANLLWSSFKDRLGTSEFSSMSFDLGSILDSHDLDHLGNDFSQEEIDLVIRSLPTNHAPGPDGFNGLFIKKCWPIIQEDFTRLLKDFSSNNVDISSINSSFIALIPKKDNPEKFDDFRPISLLNYSLKCITKILSNRL